MISLYNKFVKVQYDINYMHIIVQKVFRTFSSCMTETIPIAQQLSIVSLSPTMITFLLSASVGLTASGT